MQQLSTSNRPTSDGMDGGHQTLNNAKPVIDNLQNKQGTVKTLKSKAEWNLKDKISAGS